MKGSELKMAFDRYAFVDNLKDEIKGEGFTTEDEIERYIQESIDSALIYNSDILDIARDFNVIDYDQLSRDVYEPLYDYVLSEIDIDELLTNEDEDLDLDTFNPDDFNSDEFESSFNLD